MLREARPCPAWLTRCAAWAASDSRESARRQYDGRSAFQRSKARLAVVKLWYASWILGLSSSSTEERKASAVLPSQRWSPLPLRTSLTSPSRRTALRSSVAISLPTASSLATGSKPRMG